MNQDSNVETGDVPKGTDPGNSGPSDNSSQNGRRNNTRRSGSNPVVLSNPVTYEGECDKVGAILALKTERFNKKATYEQFVEKICNYIVKKYTDGADIKMLLTKGKDPVKLFEDKNMPEALLGEDKDDPVKEAILKEEVKQFVARKNNIRRNIQSAYSLIWGQCSSALQAYVKGQDGYVTATEDYDVTWLLNEVKKACSGIDSKANAYVTLHDAISLLYRTRQGATETDDNYVERFKNNAATVEMVQGSNLFYSPGIVGKPINEATNQEIHNAKEANLAVLMLANADPARYGDLVSSLKRGANLGRDEYPRSIAEMYELMVKHSRESTRNANRGGRKGSIFVQTKNTEENSEQDAVAGSDGVMHLKIVCFNCGRYGHYSSSCPSEARRRSGASALLKGTCFVAKQEDRPYIENHRLLLDTCSTDNVCKDITLLVGARQCNEDEVLNVIANGGNMTYNTIGTMKLFPIEAYYNKDSLANIVSMRKLSELDGVRIAMDTEKEKSIKVTTKEGKVFIFSEGDDGLYSYDMRKNIIGNKQGDNKNNENVLSDYSSSKLSFLNAVENKKANFSKIEIRKAKAARELQCTMGYIPDSTLKKYIKHKLFENCGVSEEDVDRAAEIYGIAEPIARGKMTSPTQRQSKSKQISLPSNINKDVMLYMDIFYVNGNTFLHIKSKDVDYVSIEALKSREMNVVCKKIKKIINMYEKRGFTITDVYGDNEFNNQMCVDAILPSRLHICTRGEHVPIVERSIRTVKEKARVRCQS